MQLVIFITRIYFVCSSLSYKFDLTFVDESLSLV